MINVQWTIENNVELWGLIGSSEFLKTIRNFWPITNTPHKLILSILFEYVKNNYGTSVIFCHVFGIVLPSNLFWVMLNVFILACRRHFIESKVTKIELILK